MRKNQIQHNRELAFHITTLFISGFLAIIIAQSGAIEKFLSSYGASIGLLGSFIAGFFFTSLLTTAPAIVAFVEIAQAGAPLLPMALIGGLGAMLGDLVLFQFVKFSLTDDILNYFRHSSHSYLRKLLKIKFFSITMAVLGAVVIASPLPDELGLAMLGLARIEAKFILSISFLFNATGIFIVGLIAKGL